MADKGKPLTAAEALKVTRAYEQAREAFGTAESIMKRIVAMLEDRDISPVRVDAPGALERAATAALSRARYESEKWNERYKALDEREAARCERCNRRVHPAILETLSADGVDWLACQTCRDAYDRAQGRDTLL